MNFNSYTNIVVMRANNGKLLYLTKKDEKITWTYYKKYALKFHPHHGEHHLINAFKTLSEKDKYNLRIERAFNGSNYSMRLAGISQTYYEFIDDCQEKGLHFLLKDLVSA